MTDHRLRPDGGPGVVEDLAERAVPFGPADPGAPDGAADGDGLAELVEAVGDATVVGVGEPSHGTRECFRFKHRLFRRLVETAGVRVFALEANVAAMLPVDRYVAADDGSGADDGDGAGPVVDDVPTTAADALDREGIHEPFRTGSMAALIEWARAENAGRERADRLRFHGVDVQHSGPPARHLRAYVRGTGVGRDALDQVEGPLDRLADGLPSFEDEDAVREHLEDRRAVVETLGEVLEDRRAAFVDAGSPRAHRLAVRQVRVLDRGREEFERTLGETPPEHVAVRDRAMAENVRWLLEHEGDRVFLSGHNAHVTRGRYPGAGLGEIPDLPAMGHHLGTDDDRTYYALALEVGAGTVRSRYLPKGEFRAHDVGEPPEGSVPAVCGRALAALRGGRRGTGDDGGSGDDDGGTGDDGGGTGDDGGGTGGDDGGSGDDGVGRTGDGDGAGEDDGGTDDDGPEGFFLDLRSVPADSPTGRWLDGGPVRHSIKGAYEDSPVHYAESDLRSNFDGLVYLGEGTAARGLYASPAVEGRPSVSR